MPKDNEVDEKVMPVAVVTTDGYIAWLGDLILSENWMKHSPGDFLYSAATVAELRAEVERRKDALAAMSQFAKVAEDRADAAERRVAQLERDIAGLLTPAFPATLTGADPT